jgi:two-component system response regulator NreC
LRILVERHDGWIVCGEAADGLETVEQATNLKPDVILLDISMPKLDGLSAMPLIRATIPESDIVILTLHESLEMARIAASAGARAYITKSRLSTELVLQ